MSQPTYDVIVLGGGLAGAATAEALARRETTVLLLDRFAPGHTHGSSHGDGRIFRYAYRDPVYVEMARRAYPAWQALSERAAEPLLQKTGGWDCGPAGSADLQELMQNFEQYGLAYERLSPQESNERFPWFRLPQDGAALYQADAGVVFADRALAALWRLAAQNGAETVTGQRVVAINPYGDEVRLRGESGQVWKGRRLVVAAGSWSKRLLATLGLDLPLRVTQERVAYFAPGDDVDHGLWAMPVLMDYHDEHIFYALPIVDVPGVKVGWHGTGPEVDPDDRPQPQGDVLEGIQTFVRDRFPHLDPAPIKDVTCLYTNTPDSAFVIDRHPSLASIVVGAGFSGHGFKFGPVIGEMLAALALDEDVPLSLAPFSLARFEELAAT